MNIYFKYSYHIQCSSPTGVTLNGTIIDSFENYSEGDFISEQAMLKTIRKTLKTDYPSLIYTNQNVVILGITKMTETEYKNYTKTE